MAISLLAVARSGRGLEGLLQRFHEPNHGVVVRSWSPEPPARVHNGAVDHVNFCAPGSLDVLQHGGLRVGSATLEKTGNRLPALVKGQGNVLCLGDGDRLAQQRLHQVERTTVLNKLGGKE